MAPAGSVGELPSATDTGRRRTSSTPSIGLPKDLGAVRGIAEKFAANPATGTAWVSVPVCTSPEGFGPRPLAIRFRCREWSVWLRLDALTSSHKAASALHTDERFTEKDPERPEPELLNRVDGGWHFKFTGTGFDGTFRIEVEAEEEEGE